jgi:hypothetical protein
VTYLALGVCAIRRVLERALERAGAVSAAQELADLACERLDVGARHGRNRGRERAHVEVGGGVGVQRVDVDCAPVDVGHGGVLRCRTGGDETVRFGGRRACSGSGGGGRRRCCRGSR